MRVICQPQADAPSLTAYVIVVLARHPFSLLLENSYHETNRDPLDVCLLRVVIRFSSIVSAVVFVTSALASKTKMPGGFRVS